MQPDPAAVTACRYAWSCTSPTAKTPGMFVSVESRLGDQVAGLVVVELVEEERRVRVVADRDEQAVRLELARLAGVEVAQADAGDTLRRRAPRRRLRRVTHSIFSLARARSTMICEARNSSRRWTMVTLAAKLRRGSSPPPSRSRRRRPPRRACRGRRRRRRWRSTRRRGPAACAPTRARAGGRSRRSRRSRCRRGTRRCRPRRGTAARRSRRVVTSSVRNSAPKRSAWRRNSCIISGPMTPSA